MAILFNRRIKVTIGDTVIVGLDVEFKVNRALKKDPNTCEIKIFNLSPSNRNLLQEQKSVLVSLEVGYDEFEEPSDDNLFLIWKGVLKDISSTLDGSDWITIVRTLDGKKARAARISKSFASGTKFTDMAKQLLEDSIKSIGIDVGNALKKLSAGDFNGASLESINGSVLSGNSADELDLLLQSMGLEGSIQDNEYQIIEKGKAIDPQIVFLQARSGLLGSPNPKNNGIIEVKCLLQPGIAPGKIVNVLSKSTDILGGIEYRVEKTTYTGSNYTEDWFIDFEGRQLDG